MTDARPGAGPLGPRPLLDAALAETLRLYSPIHLGRHAIEDDVVDGQSTVRAGTDVISNAWLIHRNPAVWPEPRVFRAERFLEQRVHWSQYLPFSMGPRGCPGRQLSYVVIRQVVSRVLEARELHALRQPNGSPMPAPEFRPSLVVATLPSTLPVRVVRAACLAPAPDAPSAPSCPHLALQETP